MPLSINNNTPWRFRFSSSLHSSKSHLSGCSNDWILPPLSNSWIIITVWLYIALNRTPNIDCYWVGAVPKVMIFCPVIKHCLGKYVSFLTRTPTVVGRAVRLVALGNCKTSQQEVRKFVFFGEWQNAY